MSSPRICAEHLLSPFFLILGVTGAVMFPEKLLLIFPPAIYLALAARQPEMGGSWYSCVIAVLVGAAVAILLVLDQGNHPNPRHIAGSSLSAAINAIGFTWFFLGSKSIARIGGISLVVAVELIFLANVGPE